MQITRIDIDKKADTTKLDIIKLHNVKDHELKFEKLSELIEISINHKLLIIRFIINFAM